MFLVFYKEDSAIIASFTLEDIKDFKGEVIFFFYFVL